MKNDDSPSELPGVWVRVLAAAAATVALWAVLVSVLAGEVLPFALGLGVLFVVLAAATLLWPGRVVYWVAIVVSIATLTGGAQFVVSDLGHPESALAFVPALLPELARLTVIVAAVGALRRWDANLARRVVLVPVGVFVVLALVGCRVGIAGTGAGSDRHRPLGGPFDQSRGQSGRRPPVSALKRRGG